VQYIVTLKVYGDTDEKGNVDRNWYKVKNSQEVYDMELCTGDKMLIDGIGNLEILGILYVSEESGKNPYRSLEVTCGLVNLPF
jgi:hypothetical protein